MKVYQRHILYVVFGILIDFEKKLSNKTLRESIILKFSRNESFSYRRNKFMEILKGI